MATKRNKGNPIPLIAEDHPEEYNGYPFITLLQYNKTPILAIIDNVTDKQIKAFSLDLCGPEGINEEELIDVARIWYESNRSKYPISFEFARLELAEKFSKVYRTYNIEFIARAIGPLPKFDMSTPATTRRRRRKPLSAGIEVQQPSIKFDQKIFQN